MNAVTSVSRRGLIARGEGAALIASAATYFLLLCGYYMLRSLREAFALEAGREHIPLLFTITLAVQLAILPVYWWIVGRVRRDRLLTCLYLPVTVLFLALAMAARQAPVPPLTASLYFIAVTSLNLFLVSVFWSTMVDLWSPGASQRLFGIIAGGGSAGALAGPAFNAAFVQKLGVSAVIYTACALLVAAVATGIAAQRMLARSQARETTVYTPVGGRAADDLLRLVRSPYLLLIAVLIVVGQWIGAFMYNEQARYVAAAYTHITERAALFARIDLASSLLALLLQTLVVGWLSTRGGVRATLTATFALVATSLAALAAVPTGTVLLVTQVVRRGGDYGLFKPAREMLFTVLRAETKFKSKSLLDTVLQRGADSVGNGLYLLVAPLGLAGIAGVSASACVLLMLGARWLGATFADEERKGTR